MNKEFIRIDDWHPTRVKKTIDAPYIFTDVKLIQLNIAKCFPRSTVKGMSPEALDAMSKFYIDRTVYHNSIQIIADYIDYFLTFYDDDKELIGVYIYLKGKIDDNVNNIDILTFKKELIGGLFKRSSIKQKIFQLVEDNYQLDVTKDGTNREFLDKDDFTNEDAKALLAISTMIKIAIPPLIHWVSINKQYNKKEKNNLITDTFMTIFEKMCTEEMLDSVIHKLYKFTNGKVISHRNSNAKLWTQQSAVRGVTEDNFTDKLTDEYLITSNIFKFNFKQHIMAFIKTVVESQLGHTFVDAAYKKNIIQIDNNKGANGLSSIDKAEQTIAKFDEAQLDICAVSIEKIIEMLEESVGGISDDEIKFYMYNCSQDSNFQTDLVYNHFAKYFRGFRENYNMNNWDYTKLVIILKRQLEQIHYYDLSNMITARVEGKIKSRLIQNMKFINKLENSATYKNLMEQKYPALIGFRDNHIKTCLSIAITNKFSYVEYEEPELLGETFVFNEDIISDELLNFMDSI